MPSYVSYQQWHQELSEVTLQIHQINASLRQTACTSARHTAAAAFSSSSSSSSSLPSSAAAVPSPLSVAFSWDELLRVTDDAAAFARYRAEREQQRQQQQQQQAALEGRAAGAVDSGATGRGGGGSANGGASSSSPSSSASAAAAAATSSGAGARGMDGFHAALARLTALEEAVGQESAAYGDGSNETHELHRFLRSLPQNQFARRQRRPGTRRSGGGGDDDDDGDVASPTAGKPESNADGSPNTHIDSDNSESGNDAEVNPSDMIVDMITSGELSYLLAPSTYKSHILPIFIETSKVKARLYQQGRLYLGKALEFVRLSERRSFASRRPGSSGSVAYSSNNNNNNNSGNDRTSPCGPLNLYGRTAAEERQREASIAACLSSSRSGECGGPGAVAAASGLPGELFRGLGASGGGSGGGESSGEEADETSDVVPRRNAFAAEMRMGGASSAGGEGAGGTRGAAAAAVTTTAVGRFSISGWKRRVSEMIRHFQLKEAETYARMAFMYLQVEMGKRKTLERLPGDASAELANAVLCMISSIQLYLFRTDGGDGGGDGGGDDGKNAGGGAADNRARRLLVREPLLPADVMETVFSLWATGEGEIQADKTGSGGSFTSAAPPSAAAGAAAAAARLSTQQKVQLVAGMLRSGSASHAAARPTTDARELCDADAILAHRDALYRLFNNCPQSLATAYYGATTFAFYLGTLLKEAEAAAPFYEVGALVMMNRPWLLEHKRSALREKDRGNERGAGGAGGAGGGKGAPHSRDSGDSDEGEMRSHSNGGDGADTAWHRTDYFTESFPAALTQLRRRERAEERRRGLSLQERCRTPAALLPPPTAIDDRITYTVHNLHFFCLSLVNCVESVLSMPRQRKWFVPPPSPASPTSAAAVSPQGTTLDAVLLHYVPGPLLLWCELGVRVIQNHFDAYHADLLVLGDATDEEEDDNERGRGNRQRDRAGGAVAGSGSSPRGENTARKLSAREERAYRLLQVHRAYLATHPMRGLIDLRNRLFFSQRFAFQYFDFMLFFLLVELLIHVCLFDPSVHCAAGAGGGGGRDDGGGRLTRVHLWQRVDAVLRLLEGDMLSVLLWREQHYQEIHVDDTEPRRRTAETSSSGGSGVGASSSNRNRTDSVSGPPPAASAVFARESRLLSSSAFQNFKRRHQKPSADSLSHNERTASEGTCAAAATAAVADHSGEQGQQTSKTVRHYVELLRTLRGLCEYQFNHRAPLAEHWSVHYRARDLDDITSGATNGASGQDEADEKKNNNNTANVRETSTATTSSTTAAATSFPHLGSSAVRPEPVREGTPAPTAARPIQMTAEEIRVMFDKDFERLRGSLAALRVRAPAAVGDLVELLRHRILFPEARS